MKIQSSYLMQTMECTCLPLLQRWPTPRTQKDPFHKEVLTRDKSYGATLTPPTVFLSILLGHLAQCNSQKKDSSHEYFASFPQCLVFPQEFPSKNLAQ